MNVQFCGDKAGATLFPAHIYHDDAGELVTLMQREVADDQRHFRSMSAFVDRVKGSPVAVAEAQQGYEIQRLVEAIYAAAEQGVTIAL